MEQGPDLETKPMTRKRTTNRFRPDGTYDSKPCDPNYFRDYYKNTLSVKCKCDRCGRMVCKARLVSHRTTDLCRHIVQELANLSHTE